MPEISKIKGVSKLINDFTKLKNKSKRGDDVDYIVGYTANYALFVHEDLESRHPVGQAKFLEQPARELRGELISIIAVTRRTTGTLDAGIKLAALRLQRESQKLVPIDTGNLKGSAFTRKIK